MFIDMHVERRKQGHVTKLLRCGLYKKSDFRARFVAHDWFLLIQLDWHTDTVLHSVHDANHNQQHPHLLQP